MEFRISDTFTDSLAKLTNDEQKAVKTTAFDLQMNPANPGMQFHKLDKARDTNFWSVRVSRDIRLIVHKTDSSLLLCYVDHHDQAYQWAERRKLEIHPKTGAAQLVQIRETFKEIITPKYIEAEEIVPEKPLLFADLSDSELLSYGVPIEWLEDVRKANEDTVLELAEHLPAEAAEALLDLATGTTPSIAAPLVDTEDPFEHPDAQRRFRVMKDIEELERALEFPWEKWTVFLHPAQRELVEQDYNGAARVAGSAGTGKTIVALHRSVFLARKHLDARILLTTFSDTLTNVLHTKLRRLISNTPRLAERIEVYTINGIGRRLYELHFGRPNIATEESTKQILHEIAGTVEDNKFSLNFLMTEWQQVVDAWQLDSWEAYRDVLRLGRKTRLPENQRKTLWIIFERLRSELSGRNLLTHAQIFGQLGSKFTDFQNRPFDFVVIDEAQDISVAQLRFLAVMDGEHPDSLFFSGDLGQRIFQQPFSWKALGVDVRGRSRILRINYRTSHQIRKKADKLLGPEISDVDGNTEDRRGAISVFNGPQPNIIVWESAQKEIEAVSKWLTEIIADGIQPEEVAIFVRSEAEFPRAISALKAAGVHYKQLDNSVETTHGHVSLSTMHLAKGLEFRAVAVIACDDEVIPLQSRIETVADDADLEEVYSTERHLLYVACTRARDRLLVSGVQPASEFLDDLRM